MGRVVLVGRGGSGKDHLRKILVGRGFSYGISYTTRPPRKNETDGIDYFFLEESEFDSLEESDFFYESISFNGWKYGTSKKQWYDKDNLFIMTPYGVSKILPEDRKDTTIIYLDIPVKIIFDRLSARGDSDSVDRRMASDNRDFYNFTDYDIKITNSDF